MTSMSSFLHSAFRCPTKNSVSNPQKHRASVLHIRRLSVLPEEDELCSSLVPLPAPCPSPSHLDVPCKPPSAKRLSRYGRENILGLSSDDDLTFERPRPAPRPPVTASSPCPPVAAPAPSAPAPRRPVRLSTFDFDLSSCRHDSRRFSRLPADSDLVALPAPPSPTLSCTSDVDVDLGSLNPPVNPVRLSTFSFDIPALELEVERAPSPAGSFASDYTSTSGTSTDMPLTPTSFDDEWPMSPEEQKLPTTSVPHVPTRRPATHKAAPKPKFKFPPVEHDEHEDDATWYARELGARFELLTPPPASSTFPRPSLTTIPSSPRTSSSPRSTPSRSRFSKPLPALPPPPAAASTSIPGPSTQLDPTFASARPALPPRAPPARLQRKRLTITVPRPPSSSSSSCPSTDGEDIFADGASWAPSPHTRSGALLSPPRLPESPYSATSPSMLVDPAIAALAVNGADAVLETTHAGVVPETAPGHGVPRTVLAMYDASASASARAVAGPVPAIVVSDHAAALDNDDDDNDDTSNEEGSPLLRSRWSSSTLGSHAEQQTSGAGPLSPRMLSFHLGNVARRVVRARRASGGRTRSVAVEVEVASPRSSCSSDGAASSSGEGMGVNGLRRKAIPVELFMRP